MANQKLSIVLGYLPEAIVIPISMSRTLTSIKGIIAFISITMLNRYVQLEDWTVQESKSSGQLINVATLVSSTGPDSNPTATVAIYLDKLHNSTTTLNNYAHFVAFADYENRPYFHAFKLLELSTNSSILGKSAYTLIGTYQDPSAGSQKIMEVGTIIGDKAYSVQYIADAHRYSDYLLAVQNMIDSMQIRSQGNGHYGMSETVTGPNNITATLTAPPGNKINNFIIIPVVIPPVMNKVIK